MPQMVAMRLIRADAGCQPRAMPDAATVAEYADAMRGGAEFPPVVLFHDGADHYLADGYHRYGAAQKLKRSEILADVRQGTLRDAILFSLGANQSHGLRRTNGDKRRAVIRLFQDDEWQKWSDSKIADHCGVSSNFVRELRKEIAPGTLKVNLGEPEKRIGRDGKSYAATRAPRPTVTDRDIAQPEPDDDEPARQVHEDITPPPAVQSEPGAVSAAATVPRQVEGTAADEPGEAGLVTDPGEGGDTPDRIDLVEGSVFGNEPGVHTPEAVEIEIQSELGGQSAETTEGATDPAVLLGANVSAGATAGETATSISGALATLARAAEWVEEADTVTLPKAEYEALVKRADATPFLVVGRPISAIEYCYSLLRGAVDKITPEDAARQYSAAMWADDVERISIWADQFDSAFRNAHGNGTDAALEAE